MKKTVVLLLLSMILLSSQRIQAQFKVHSDGQISFQSTNTTGGVQINPVGKASFEPNITSSGALLTQTRVFAGLVKAWDVNYIGNPPEMPFDRFYVTGIGDAYAHSHYTISSGGGQTKDFYPINNASEMISSLNGFYFDSFEYEGFTPDFLNNPNIIPGAVEGMMKDLNIDKTLGISVESLEVILPEAIRHDPEGMVYINYSAIIPVLVEAFKEQQQKIEQLETILKDNGLLKH